MSFREIKPFTVSELNRQIRLLMEREWSFVWVEGEISNLRTPYSGHSYFTLKDENSQLKAVLFKGARAYLGFDPEDGQQVLVKGRVTVYEPRGDYQIVVDYMEPRGYGALQKAFEQLKESLSREGLFDEKHKKPIPVLPKKIGIVTSVTGAAIRDILQILERRFPDIGVVIAPAKVQGEGAAEEIVAAIEALNDHARVDVIILGRGGGSLEDLWSFNKEEVARAIFKSKIPIISAVGHEIDFTIADFTADLRAPTPSAAAELAVPEKRELEATLESLQKGLVGSMKVKVEARRERLGAVSARRVFREPAVYYQGRRQRLDDRMTALARNMGQILSHKKNMLEHGLRSLELLYPAQRISAAREKVRTLSGILNEKAGYIIHAGRGILEKEAGRLEALSPLAVLSRGFSVCRTLERKVVRDSAQVDPGDKISLLLHKGEIFCRVEKKAAHRLH